MRCGAEDLTNQVGEGMLEEKSIQEQGMQAAEFDWTTPTYPEKLPQ